MKTLRGVSSIVLMVSFAVLCLSPGPEAALLFSPPIDYSTSLPTYMTKGDFNNDSITDIAVTSWTNNNMTVFRGDGAGGFTALSPRTVAPGTHPNKIVTGYFNSDSNLDVAIALGIPRTIIIFFGDGDGNFTSSNTVDVGSDSDANALVSGFFDGDTTADIAVAKDSGVGPDHVRIFSGDGAGAFTSFPETPHTGSMPYYIITADFNGDLKADLAIANLSGNSVTILLGNGDGSFTEAGGSPITVGTNPATIFAADFNNDNIVDLAVANFGSSTVSVLLGNGSGGFSEAAGSPLSAGSGTVGVTSADLNLDSNADLAVTNSSDGTVSVFEGNGDGTFKTKQDFNAGAQPGDLISADFNGDGRPDLAFVRSGNMSVLINNPQCVQPPSGLVSWWGGDNNAMDMVGNNNGTLVNGATYAPGMVGQAFSFDGVDDYVNVGDLDLPSTFTIDAWIKPIAVNTQLILTKGDVGHGNRAYAFYLGNSGTLDLYVKNGSSQATFYESASNAITAGQWNHVAVVYDGNAGAGQKIKFYVNGQDANSGVWVSNDAGGTSENNLANAIIGSNELWELPFAGLIDEVEIFNRALSLSEIQDIYNAGSSGKCRSCTAPLSGMVSWLGGDNNALDMVGTNNGTLMNGATYAAGKVSQAFSLDGVDDYVEIPHSDSLNFGATQPMSMNLWVKRTSTSNLSTIFSKRPDCGTQVHYLLQWYGPGNWFVFGSTGAPANGVTTTADKLPLNTWTFISVSFDGTTVTMYINGAPVASHAMSFDPNTVPLALGAEPSCGDYFGGLIDEFEIFNRALSAEEIAAIYNAGSAGKCRACVAPPADMVSWWKGDGNAADNVGTNHGTLMNGATFASGMVGEAFSFDGATVWDPSWISSVSYVEMPAGIGDFGSSDFTVDFWMYAKRDSSAGDFLIGKSYADAGLGWDIRRHGKAIEVVGVNGWPANYNIQSAGIVNANEWHHVAVSAGASTVTLYIDGVSAGASGRSAISSTSNPFRVGFQANFGGYAHNGLIDELELFNRALSAEEIAAIAKATDKGKCFTPDTTPEGFTFTDVTGATRSTVYTSNTITVSGINTAAPISITTCTGSGCQYRINSGSWVSTAGTVNNGDSVIVHQTSSGSYSTTMDLTLSIGGVTDTYSVTTVAAPPPTYTITANVKDATGGNISCDTPVTEGSPSVCTIIPDTGHYLSALTDNGGNVLGSVSESLTYTISGVTEAHTVEATFSEYMIKRVSSLNHYYNLLTEAFEEVVDSDTVMLRQGTFAGSAYDRTGVAIMLKGGYNTGFGSNAGQFSMISGPVTISSGTVTVENVTIL